MDKTMRLQCRVTPATQELHAHLETIDPDYRGKRLVAMAALYLSMISATEDAKSKSADTQENNIAAEDKKDQAGKEPISRPVASWIRGANV
ncbi:hypothetical protein FA378_10920 [Pseudomonas aeruginosa]|uniref:Uncharacterized protein n=1 Tax=Pseudomonas aeruginosa TaxID=287 RepID=A0A6B1YI66_PSEAI|nr:hypothetical protein [Pseudomonas aeruginosa]MCO2275011.1 hypothetical protein [Pseudomonas aeruginosa]MCO2762503.1 hypothetical protein [Pseudomonas aeruginosa]MCO2767708.1 hypothetical protein [Pseudomonas aeruginosa]MDY1103190.1 hypothetical protein [Pseudomonas aeruginosa]MZZ16543.1 hypothetical protein [Pseudomonas aeruginosa]